ncbi:MAG: four helix bundle protein [bacterium]
MARVAIRFRDLEVYQRSFLGQQRVFDLSKTFPREEKYSLTDQVRRSSRAIGANIAEAWQKRRYPAHFVSKLTDADAELAETLHWLSTAFASGYIVEAMHADLNGEYEAIGRTIGGMMIHADTWCASQSTVHN